MHGGAIFDLRSAHKRVSPHVLRHTTAMELLQSGKKNDLRCGLPSLLYSLILVDLLQAFVG